MNVIQYGSTTPLFSFHVDNEYTNNITRKVKLFSRRTKQSQTKTKGDQQENSCKVK